MIPEAEIIQTGETLCAVLSKETGPGNAGARRLKLNKLCLRFELD